MLVRAIYSHLFIATAEIDQGGFNKDLIVIP